MRRRDSAPAQIPPDWHDQEQATTRGMGMVQRVRGVPLKLRDGSQITVQGNGVVGRSSDGTSRPLTASDGDALHGTNTPLDRPRRQSRVCPIAEPRHGSAV